MKDSINVLLNNHTNVDMELKVFNGGEVNVQLPDNRYPRDVCEAVISARMVSADGIMALLQTVDALHRRFSNLRSKNITLVMHYAPYARQDRVCNVGESLSSKVFADLINTCKFKQVIISDPHSDVMSALLDNCVVEDIADILRKDADVSKSIRDDFTIVAPDFGATKKVEKVAKEFGNSLIIQGVKHRDMKTGQLSGFGYYGDVKGKHLLIVDDICDGGGTFIGLSNILKADGALSVDLYVTHGVFSRGVQYLLDNGIDGVITTDSLPQDSTQRNLHIIKL